MLCCPVQTRMMTRTKVAGESNGMLATILRIAREDGLKTFWAGLIPAFILTTNPAIQSLMYDRMKHYWQKQLAKRDKPRNPSAVELFIMGAM
jgi:hypothetical protein